MAGAGVPLAAVVVLVNMVFSCLLENGQDGSRR